MSNRPRHHRIRRRDLLYLNQDAKHERTHMDFIERWFGISPDGGSGLTELSYILLLLVVLGILLYRRFAGRSARDDQQKP